MAKLKYLPYSRTIDVTHNRRIIHLKCHDKTFSLYVVSLHPPVLQPLSDECPCHQIVDIVRRIKSFDIYLLLIKRNAVIKDELKFCNRIHKLLYHE